MNRLVLAVWIVAAGVALHPTITFADWRAEWERTQRAAEKEGQLVLYSLSETGEVLHGGFQKKFPRIKLVSVAARGVELVSRIMAERRAGKFLADGGRAEPGGQVVEVKGLATKQKRLYEKRETSILTPKRKRSC